MAEYQRASVGKMQEQLSRARTTIASIKEKATEAMREGKAYLEVDGTAFLFGYLRGRMTDPADEDSFKVAGLAPDLLAGAAIATIGFLGAFDKYSEDAHNVARGALASYATVQGVQFGVEAREAKGEGTGVLPIGTPGVGTRGSGRQIGGRRGAQVGARRSPMNESEQMAGAGAGRSRAGA